MAEPNVDVRTVAAPRQESHDEPTAVKTAAESSVVATATTTGAATAAATAACQSVPPDTQSATSTSAAAEAKTTVSTTAATTAATSAATATAAAPMRLKRAFFDRTCDLVARELLGKVLCRRSASGAVLRGRVVETEMYPGQTDRASHSFENKKTRRNGAMFMAPGTAYVYVIYGMYHCFNVSTREPGGCVLIRALEPTGGGQQEMAENRAAKSKFKNKKKELRPQDLCSGPSKLCLSLDINRDGADGVDLCAGDDGGDQQSSSFLWFEDGPAVPSSLVRVSRRVGIDGAGQESRDKPFRFYERGCRHVSVVDAEDRPLLKRGRAELEDDGDANK